MPIKTFPAISIRQPWADLIVRGIKDIENRPWPTRFRGKILIQAAQKIDRDGLDHRTLADLLIESADDYHPYTMAIIGMAEIIDCVTKHPSRFFKGPHGFVLKNAVRFRRPIAYSGRLGIFSVPLSQLQGTPAARVRAGEFVT